MRSARAVAALLALLGCAASAPADSPPGDAAPVGTRTRTGLALVASPTVAALASRAPARYAFLPRNGSPFVELALSPTTRGWFLVDTGANVSGVDEEWVKNERLPFTLAGNAKVAGLTGGSTYRRAAFDRVDFGHATFEKPVFNLQSFAHFHGPEGRKHAGLLGTNYLLWFALTFDWKAKTLDVALKEERAPPDPKADTVPLAFPANIPTITATVGGLAIDCRLDTGASYLKATPVLDVNPAAVEALKAKGIALRQVETITMSGVAGKRRLPVLAGNGLTLTVGKVEIRDLRLVLHDHGALVRKAPLALAGIPILTRLGRTTFDPFDEVLRLEGE